MICVCGADLTEAATCPGCGLARVTVERMLRARAAAAQTSDPPDAATVEHLPAAACLNCWTRIPRDADRTYCPACQALWDASIAALAELGARQARRYDPLDLPGAESVYDQPALQQAQIEREAAGLLDQARPGTRWLAKRYPDLAFLCYQTSPALDFWRDTRNVLAEFFDHIPPEEWRLLLDLDAA